LKQADRIFNRDNNVNISSGKRLSEGVLSFKRTGFYNCDENLEKDDMYSLQHNKRFDTINCSMEQNHSHTPCIVSDYSFKRKAQCLEDENHSTQQNNLINFNALKNEITLNTGKKIETEANKTSLIGISPKSSASCSSSSSSSTSSSTSSASSASSTSSSSESSSSPDDSSSLNVPSKSTFKTNQRRLIDNKNQQRAPHGKGLASTKARNMRKKRTKKLLKLKQQGILPESATFVDLLKIEEETNKIQNNKNIEIKPLRKYIKNKSKGFITKINNSQSKHIKFDEDGRVTSNNTTNDESWKDRCILKEVECELPNIPVQRIFITSNNKT
ncbi:hypothetical protein PCK2_001006, partial [Pneumocystis canis]